MRLFDIISVNALRYDGQGWYCATTDGRGVDAFHFGIDVLLKEPFWGITGAEVPFDPSPHPAPIRWKGRLWREKTTSSNISEFKNQR